MSDPITSSHQDPTSPTPNVLSIPSQISISHNTISLNNEAENNNISLSQDALTPTTPLPEPQHVESRPFDHNPILITEEPNDVTSPRKRRPSNTTDSNVVLVANMMAPPQPREGYIQHPETPLTPALGENEYGGQDVPLNDASYPTRTSRASSMDSNASSLASSHTTHDTPYPASPSPSPNTSTPSLTLHLSSIFASYTNTLHASLTIQNNITDSHSVTSPLTLGQNLYAGSASYYDSKRLPREIWRVESVLSQIEGYLRLHSHWICSKQKFLEATLGIHTAQHAAYLHHTHTKNRLVKLLSTDTLQRRHVTLQDATQNNQHHITSSSLSIKDANRIVLFQSPVCELYRGGEVILQHETANLPFSVYIPANLPPEYLSGQLIKFRYILRLKVVLFNSHYGRKEVELELPFKVTNPAASLARISCRHILSGTSFMPDDVFQWTLYKDWNSVVGGRRWKLESLDRLSSSDTNRFSTQTRYIFESIRRHVQSKQEKIHFDIQTKTGAHVCRFTLSSTAFQIGDSIFGFFDFSRREATCHRITCRLLSEEIIHEKYLSNPNTKLDASLTQKAHAHFAQHVSSLRSYPIYFTIPAQIQPQFKTDVIDLTWQLSFEFLLEGAGGEETLSWRLPIEIFNLVSGAEQSVTNRNEVSMVVDL